MRYSLIRKVHFYVALVLAVPLIVLSVTGAILVYGHELQRLISPDGWVVEPQAQTLSHVNLLEQIKTQRPDLPVWALSASNDASTPYTAWLSNQKGVLKVNQYNGDILTHYFPNETFEGWVTALHRRYLTEGETARWVRHFVSFIALMLLVEIILGLWIWLIPPKPFKRLKVKARHSTRMKILRLHQLSGVVTSLLLIAITFTGFAMWWTAPSKAIIETVTFSKVADNPPPEMQNLAELSNLSEAVAIAQKALPNAALKTLRPPSKPKEPAILSFSTETTSKPLRVWVGDNPPSVLHQDVLQQVNAATWLWHMRYKIHVGDFAGPIVRALWVLIALMPTAFVVSGIWLYLKRRDI